MSFSIIHKDHAGAELGQVIPKSLNWGMSLGGIGYINYEIPINHPFYYLPFPYMTDFFLIHDPSAIEIMGGFVTSVELNDINENGIISVAGKEWLHYLERIIWPKDPNSSYRTKTYDDPTNGTVFDEVGGPAWLVSSLVEQATAITYSYTMIMNNPFDSGSFRYVVMPGDTQTIFEKVTEILQLQTGTGIKKGFRFSGGGSGGNAAWFDFGPTVPHVYIFEHLRNCVVKEYRILGIKGTRTLGIAQGPSSRKAYYHNSALALDYRRLDSVEEFSEANSFANLNVLTEQRSHNNALQQLEINIESSPFTLSLFYENPIWTVVKPGSTVKLVADLGYTTVDDDFLVTAVECSQDENRSVVTTYTLDSLETSF